MKSDPRDEIVEHLGPLRAFARSLTRNPSMADDMVQDALVKAWTKIHTFEQGTNLRAWLFTIMHNVFVNQIKAAAHIDYMADDVLPAATLAHYGREITRLTIELNTERIEELGHRRRDENRFVPAAA